MPDDNRKVDHESADAISKRLLDGTYSGTLLTDEHPWVVDRRGAFYLCEFRHEYSDGQPVDTAPKLKRGDEVAMSTDDGSGWLLGVTGESAGARIRVSIKKMDTPNRSTIY